MLSPTQSKITRYIVVGLTNFETLNRVRTVELEFEVKRQGVKAKSSFMTLHRYPADMELCVE